ncbi:hypothetical protein CBA19C8_01440 [Paraburkholderia terrae]|nr:hypothetical protein CBA19C8_01440 [Paraburkholderia terrae]
MSDRTNEIQKTLGSVAMLEHFGAPLLASIPAGALLGFAL